MEKHIISILVNNNAGVLIRIAGLFSRRGYNIDSLSVGETETPEVSRMTVVVHGDEYIITQIKKQVAKLDDVLDAYELPEKEAIMREHILIKLAADVTNRTAIIEVANIFRANIINVTTKTLTLELTGDPSKINAFLEILSQFAIVEIVRTGLTALLK